MTRLNRFWWGFAAAFAVLMAVSSAAEQLAWFDRWLGSESMLRLTKTFAIFVAFLFAFRLVLALLYERSGDRVQHLIDKVAGS